MIEISCTNQSALGHICFGMRRHNLLWCNTSGMHKSSFQYALLFVQQKRANVPSTPLGNMCKEFMAFPSIVVRVVIQRSARHLYVQYVLTGRGVSSRRAAGLQPSLINLWQKIPPNGQTRLTFGFSYENFTTQTFSVLPTPFWLNVS